MRLRATCLGLVLTLAACSHPAPTGAPAPSTPAVPNPDVHPLAAMAGEPMMITPVQAFRSAVPIDVSTWGAAARQALDSALTDTLRARVGSAQWVYAAGLVQSAKENPTYATDPRALSVQALRAGKLKVDDRLPEPLASQLRTMIALHEGRLVLIPLELRLDKIETGIRPVLRLVLVDPRSSVIRWFADLPGVDTPIFSGAFAGPLASRVADLFVAR